MDEDLKMAFRQARSEGLETYSPELEARVQELLRGWAEAERRERNRSFDVV